VILRLSVEQIELVFYERVQAGTKNNKYKDEQQKSTTAEQRRV